MGSKRNITNSSSDMLFHTSKRMKANKMESILASNILPSFFDDVELHSSPASMLNDDMWKKFELPTPPLSPQHDGSDDLELENITMPFDIDTEDLLLFDDQEFLKEVARVFPDAPPGQDPIETLQSNLIQDIMWSAPAKPVDNTSPKVPCVDNTRPRCNSCSIPMNATCVAPDEVLMETSIGGTLSQTKVESVHSLGIETPSDSEEEIDVVTVAAAEKFVSVPTNKRKYRSDDESSNSGSEMRKPRTVTLTIEHKSGHSHSATKCSAVRQRVDCPTDVHNYSLPVSSLKRVHSYPSSPVTHKSKKLRRDINIPSELRKVAQKLKSSVGSYSRSSSDSEDMCDVGKRTQHNVLERKRRTDLKNSFFHLRDSVPDLEGQERAPKVVILRKASQYIYRLIEEQRQKDREIEQLKLRKEKLKRHLSRLREY